MKEIFDKIIEIDNKAKIIVEEEKNKKENIEDFIESEYTTKKVVLDLEYKDEIEKEKASYEEKFNQIKEEIDNKTNKEIEEIREKYNQNRNRLIAEFFEDLKRGDEV